MSNDSDPIKVSRRCPDDITSIILDIASHVQFKFLALMLLIFVFLSSDVFINRILSTFRGAVDYKCPTNWGTCLQGLFLVLTMIIIDVFIHQGVI